MIAYNKGGGNDNERRRPWTLLDNKTDAKSRRNQLRIQFVQYGTD